MIFGCDAVARSHASISALKLLSLHMCGGAALWRCKTVGWCLTGCGRACCDTGSAAHSHPVTVDKPMHKSVLVHPAILPTIVGGTALMRARRLLWGVYKQGRDTALGGYKYAVCVLEVLRSAVISDDQVIRENPASRGTETSAEVLVGQVSK